MVENFIITHQNCKMEIGYFHQSKKMWIKNRLNLNDVSKLVQNGERVTLWCMGAVTEPSTPTDGQKRTIENSSSSGEELASKRVKKKLSMDEKKAVLADFEHKLQQKHVDKYSHFQIKIWAESRHWLVGSTLIWTPPPRICHVWSRKSGQKS